MIVGDDGDDGVQMDFGFSFDAAPTLDMRVKQKKMEMDGGRWRRLKDMLDPVPTPMSDVQSLSPQPHCGT